MQVSWIDPDELGRLAAELQAPMPQNTDPEQGFLPGLTFLEPDGSVTLIPPYAERPAEQASAPDPAAETAVAPEILHIREQLRSIRQRAQQAGLIGAGTAVETSRPSPPPQPPAPPAVVDPIVPAQLPSPNNLLPLEGTMAERLEAFAKWVSRLLASDELILVDDQGGLLWSPKPPSDLTMSAILAMTSALRSSALDVCEPPEIIRNKLSQQRELSVLPCITRHGVVSLAISNAAGIPHETVGWLREALVLSVNGRNEEQPS